MWSVLRKSLICTSETACSIIKDTKRFAGHSKWANIKHIKAEKDGEKAIVFAKLIRQMKVAITEEGSYKPSENLRLAQIIEQAKKKSMPMATINGVLEKVANSTAKAQSSTLDIRGPGGCIMVVQLHSDNMKHFKMTLNTVLRKHNSSTVDQSCRHVFHHKGIIVTELLDLDRATEDAITVGAEDVEEIDDNGKTHLKFTCEANVLSKVVNQLGKLKYDILSSEEQFIPHIFANLNDAELEKASSLYTKLGNFDEVVKIHDNIA